MKKTKIKNLIQRFMITTLAGAMLTIPLAEYKAAFASDSSSLAVTSESNIILSSHNFTTNGINSDFFSIKGSLSTKKGVVNYNGVELTQCLKVNSFSDIKFTTSEDSKLTLVFNSDFNKKIKIDGIKEKVNDGIITIDLKAGSHVIEKGNSANLYYMELSSSSEYIKIDENTSIENNESSNNANIIDTEFSAGSLNSTGTYTNLINTEDNKFLSAVYVSPNGASNNDGSLNKPMDLDTALKKVTNGEKSTILLLAGTYKYNNQININSSGSKDSYNVLKAAEDAEVIFDFSEQPYNSSDTSKNDRGLQLNGNYWYISGITIKSASDNGMLLAGSYNTIERCIFDGNRDTGLQISRKSSSVSKDEWPSYNSIINCTSKNNCDPASYENADGFAAKLTVGEGNVFDGCLSYNNSDDGWDLYAKSETGSIGVVTIRNSIAMRNGMTEDGTTKSSCDGNGFKLGGSGVGTPHIITNCIAIENLHHGFTDNNNPDSLQVTNCTAFDNNIGGGKNNFSLYRCKDAVVSNIISYTTNKTSDKLMNLKVGNSVYISADNWYKVTESKSIDTSKSLNGDKISDGVKNNDFISTSVPKVGTDFDKVWRNSDGTINTNGIAVVSSSSLYSTFSNDKGILGARFSNKNKVETVSIKIK